MVKLFLKMPGTVSLHFPNEENIILLLRFITHENDSKKFFVFTYNRILQLFLLLYFIIMTRIMEVVGSNSSNSTISNY